ncbi:MAG: helix-turn-helix domain-containing protein [Cyclobacteriaceae bacterium]
MFLRTLLLVLVLLDVPAVDSTTTDLKRSEVTIHLLAGLSLAQGSDSVYQCPPCGCHFDGMLFSKPGICGSCKMPLKLAKTGVQQVLNESLSPFFNGTALRKTYPKIIYPIFIASMIFAVFLLIFSRESSSSPFLALIILVVSLYGFKHQLYGVPFDLATSNRSLFAPLSFITLIGPLCFFLVKKILKPGFNLWEMKNVVHLLLGMMVFCSYILLFLSPPSVRALFLSSPFEVSFGHLEQIYSILSGLMYTIYSLSIHKNWANQHVAANRSASRWVFRFLIGTGLLLVFWGVLVVMNFWIFDFGIATVTYNPLWVAMAIFLIWLSVEIVIGRNYLLVRKSSLNAGNFTISDEEMVQYENALKQLMVSDRLFVNPDLNLNQLAAKMEVNPRYLSMILNNKIGSTFYDYINHYRVEEVKALFAQNVNKTLTIEAIAGQAGFKSKSSFNRAFKQFTGLTPRDFLKTQCSEN